MNHIEGKVLKSISICLLCRNGGHVLSEEQLRKLLEDEKIQRLMQPKSMSTAAEAKVQPPKIHKYIRMAPDLRTWIPMNHQHEFNFAIKTHGKNAVFTNAELTPEQLTLCEWATGRYFQKWCGAYYRAHPLDVEASVRLFPTYSCQSLFFGAGSERSFSI